MGNAALSAMRPGAGGGGDAGPWKRTHAVVAAAVTATSAALADGAAMPHDGPLRVGKAA